MLLARREAIPLTIVVVDDNGGGIFSFLPVAEQAGSVDYDRLFQTPHDLDLEKVAGLFGLEGFEVDSSESLAQALAEAAASPGVSIVHARVDADQNTQRFRETLAEAGRAVAGVLDEMAEAEANTGGAS